MTFAVLFALALPAVPETVTIALLQNEGAPSIAVDTSRTIEDELFGLFFEAGHIVSNADIASNGSSFDDPYYGVKEATLGDSDYLVLAYLEYSPAVQTDTDKKLSWAVLTTIKWRVIRLTLAKPTLDGSMDARDIEVMDSDPYKQSRVVADELGRKTLVAIRTITEGEKNK